MKGITNILSAAVTTFIFVSINVITGNGFEVISLFTLILIYYTLLSNGKKES